MLANIYQTETGKQFMQGEEVSNALLNFCTFSFDSANPKVVFTAAVVMFNHILCFKREKSLINKELKKALTIISQKISDEKFVDTEAIMGMLLCECRIVYLNKDAIEFVKENLEPNFRKNHQQLKTRTAAQNVKEAVNDVILMIFDD